MVWALLLFAAQIAVFWLLKKKFPRVSLNFYLAFILLFGLFSTYSWAHMILSETIVTYLLIPAYALIFLKSIHNYRLTIADIVIVSLTTALALLTSFTFVFVVAILWMYILYYFLKEPRSIRQLLQICIIIIAPYLLFTGYLLLSGSLQEFYEQAIVYNRDYYIYNFPKVAGEVSKSPARYALSIFYNNSVQFHSLLVQAGNFNFSYPVTITFLLGNVGLIGFLLIQKKYSLAAILYGFIVFLNARSEPLNAAETDFHSTVYFAISLFNLVFLLKELYFRLGKNEPGNIKLLYQFALIFIGIYSFFTGLFITRSFTEKAYDKFMGNAPGIYDRPVAAPIINELVSRDEYFWIGPFELQELLYINGKQPSKYNWFLPASSRSPLITSEIAHDLEKNRPKVIVFKEYYAIFGVTPEEFNGTIVKILRENYFRISDLNREGEKYIITVNNLHNFDIADNFYFDRNRQDEIIKLLLEKQIIKEK